MDVDGPEEPVAPSPETLDVDTQDPPPSVAKPALAGVAGGEGGSEEPFDPEQRAGATYGHSKTMFEHIRDDQILTGCEVLGPFADEEEWELAKWLIKNVGHNQTEVFLKLPIIADRVQPSFDNKRTFLDSIDSLTIGAKWDIRHIPLTGDLVDNDGALCTETAELWFRDPMECVKELIGNPAFKAVMDYAPRRLFVDAEGTEEEINEMSSASWWWNMQTRLPDGSTCAPIIPSSDKTRLSQQSGDKTAWPVYLTIGNIAKDTQCKASSHTAILLGYLPTAKLDCYSDATRSVAKYRLFHYYMGLIMVSLADVGNIRVEMTCADGLLCKVHPILAAYVADYPEQCLVACCMENRCPICKVVPDDRGVHSPHPKCDMDESLQYIHRFGTEQRNAQFKAEFKTLGLCPVAPFWAGLPHTDIFEVFTPDILHQLHKGAFKDHLVSWCTTVIGEKEIDPRFKSMPSHPNVWHFKHGISMVSQWMGGEHKEMEKVFAGLVASHAEPTVIKTATAVIDFIYLSSLESHTSRSLAALEATLDVFHENKGLLLDLGVRATQKHFNIPKIHSMQHYVATIRLFGSADGFNTESPEQLHIDYAKAGYQASNKKDYIAQMMLWLQRQEAVARFTAYLTWCKDSLGLKPYSSISISASPLPVPAVTYKIAKAHPSELRNIAVSSIVAKPGINAQQFLPAIATYLRKNSSLFIPQLFDRFDLFKRIMITLPSIQEVSDLKLKNIIRASPPVAAIPTRNHSECSYQDFALIRTSERNPVTDGTALEGLRIAQARVLFKFPTYYPSPFNTAKPLAYVEWFTPFSRPEVNSDLFVVRRSS
ncbi:hypothetical protein B0H10DRAFT_2341498 [Mycena sp. CBHHK59/15]|nr:hypothetical protein B0H10DRAFT_2341498 [Mycena sp. CBHHK59/15]